MNLWTYFFGASRLHTPRRSRARFTQLALEVLEDRYLPSSVAIANTGAAAYVYPAGPPTDYGHVVGELEAIASSSQADNYGFARSSATVSASQNGPYAGTVVFNLSGEILVSGPLHPPESQWGYGLFRAAWSSTSFYINPVWPPFASRLIVDYNVSSSGFYIGYGVSLPPGSGTILNAPAFFGGSAAAPQGLYHDGFSSSYLSVGTFHWRFELADKEPPVIAVPATIRVPNDPGKAEAVVSFEVTATDNVDGSVQVTFLGKKPGDFFPVGTTTVTCEATDRAGNKAMASFDVTVLDKEPPVITTPGNLTVLIGPGPPFGAYVNYRVTALDNVDGPVSVSYGSHPPGSFFPIGTTTVVCTAIDSSGNRATATFTVTVSTVGKPKLEPPGGPERRDPPGFNNFDELPPVGVRGHNFPLELLPGKGWPFQPRPALASAKAK